MSDILFWGLTQVALAVADGIAAADPSSRLSGFDDSDERRKRAERTKLFHQVDANPESSLKSAELVLLMDALGPAEDVFPVLAAQLQPGALLIDFAFLKSEGLPLAAEHLPPDRHYLPASIVHARPDAPPSKAWFRGGLLAVVSPPGAPEQLIRVAEVIAQNLGLKTYFLDPSEADAARLTSEVLPILLDAALLASLAQSTGWRELQRLLNIDVGARLADLELNATRLATMANRAPEMMLPRLDGIIAKLQELRSLIGAGEVAQVESQLAEVIETFRMWEADRSLGVDTGEDLVSTDLPRVGLLRTLLGMPGKRREE